MRCARHAFAPGLRCERCERDWEADAPTRRAAKLMFAPPIALLCGGMLFIIMLPISFFGAFGAALMCGLACATAVGAGTAACKVFDQSARALFLREAPGALPQARLLLRHR